MKNQLEVQKRFLQEDTNMKLGHLASDLSRLASLVEMGNKAQTIKGVIEESKFFCEWSVRDFELDIQTLLAEIQSFLSQMELQWDFLSHQNEWRESVVHKSKVWSQELLQKSGLINSQ
ncbi:MAG: hypothetical protein HY583_03120 [Candidatus Omnitrophica bacterium]|nr:hypothetical protein [Candidatus Omnitrophota bacterium]